MSFTACQVSSVFPECLVSEFMEDLSDSEFETCTNFDMTSSLREEFSRNLTASQFNIDSQVHAK